MLSRPANSQIRDPSPEIRDPDPEEGWGVTNPTAISWCPRQESNPRPLWWEHSEVDIRRGADPLGGKGECRVPALVSDPEEGSGGDESNGDLLVPQAGIEPALPAPEAGALSPELLGRFKRL